MGKSKAAPDKVLAAERRVKALELRKLGFTYRKIGEQLGVTESAAHKSVTKALRDLNEKGAESAVEVRRLELERLDEWLLRIAQEIQAGKVLGAIDRGIRIQARRARLLGLDAPTRVEMREFDQRTFDELMEAMRSGDELAIKAARRIVAGEEAVAVCREWKQKSLLPLASASDTAKMTREELARGAQGLLTHAELGRIRKRLTGPSETEEARERLLEAIDRRSRAREVAEVTRGGDPGSDVEP